MVNFIQKIIECFFNTIKCKKISQNLEMELPIRRKRTCVFMLSVKARVKL